jgi:hypothetical protein
MARNIVNIETTQTFQNWLDKTNEMAAAFRTNAVTASPTGDTTAGNATLEGIFSAESLVATSGALSADEIRSATANEEIEFTSVVDFNSGTQVTALFTNNNGGRTRYTDTIIAWDVGLKDSGGNFIIDTGSAPIKFELTSAGVLSVPVFRSDNYQNADGSPFEPGTTINQLSDIGDVSTTAPQNDQVLKWDGSQWAPAADERGTATSGIQNVVEDSTPELGGNLDLNGRSIIGTGAMQISGNIITTGGVLNAQGTGTHTIGGALNVGGTVTVTGNVHATGNVRSAHSTSDIRLKENLIRIHSPLDKVMSLNGYTFNYKNNEERSAGLIAQEVEKVLPEVVYEFEEEGTQYKALRYENMVSLLVEAIKELKEEIEELKSGRN